MCGITGKLNLEKQNFIDISELKQMTDAIHHRGPDDKGFYINENIGFGFRRLSIIDLNTGHQPLSNEDGSIWIVFNGEIYNFLELREILTQQGHIFKTKTDTETIVHLYEQHGVNCLQYLRGMFSFAIWDDKRKELFCARDRFGIKPFYYYMDNEKFVFGSEIKSILRGGNINKALSHSALDMYFAYGYITSDLSIYKNINKLQPAHYLTLSFKNRPIVSINRYWKIQYLQNYSRTQKQWEDEIEEKLLETVKLHMVSDVPLGAFLSGGIDSSSVVALMAKSSPNQIKTFSIGFKEEKYNEVKFAREVAKKYNCDHHEQIVEPESISLLPKLVRAFDEPFADSSAIPTYYVSKFAKEHVKVVLTGDGGDELFAGYWNYNYLQSIYKNSSPFPKLNRHLWGSIHKNVPNNWRGKNLTHFLSKDRNYLGAYMNIWKMKERQRLLDVSSTEELQFSSELFKVKLLQENPEQDFITNLQSLDLQTYLVDDILTKVDRASMLNSLEARVPLLDHEFAELSFKIPWDLKLKDKSLKYIFKQSMARHLPENVLSHAKQGFSVPLSVWFKDSLKEYVRDTLLSSRNHLSSYVDINYVEEILDQSQSKRGNRDLTAHVWSLLFFEEWLKQNN